jgi:3-oxoacyl-[acyl-carrier protein] reductase
MSNDEWDNVVDVNLSAAFRLSKAILKPMIKSRWGRIVYLSSIVGLSGNAGQANYAAAKAGLGGFCRSLAKEVASREITVNCIAPGYIETDMTNSLKDNVKSDVLKSIPVSRFGKPEDVANAVSFLVSDDASFITGVTLNVDGGMFMS